MGGNYKVLTATECIFSGQFMYIINVCMPGSKQDSEDKKLFFKYNIGENNIHSIMK